jgi:hypothetical protein
MRPLLLAAVLLLSVPPAAAQRQVYQIDALEVRLEMLADGRYVVEEDITFGFREGTFTQGFRVIPGRRIDEVRAVEVASGDAAISEVEHDRDGRDHVIVWSFPERSQPATFTLRYEVTGALVDDGEQNVIDWDAVGDAIEVPVENVRVRVTLPDFGLTADDITIRPAGEGVLERVPPGWRATFTHPRLAAETPYRVMVAFPRQIEGRSPPAGRILLLYGFLAWAVGLLPGVRAYRRRRSPRPPADAPAERPTLPLPLVATLLLDGVTFSVRTFPAVLFDLARRGHLSLRQTTDKRWHGTKERLEVDLHPQREDLSDFEAAFLDELAKYDSFQQFTEKTSTWRYEARKPLRADLMREGLLTDERDASNRLLLTAAVVALAGLAVSFTLSGGALAVAIGFTIGAAMGALVAADPRWRRTGAGAEATARARAFLRELRTSIDAALDRGDPAGAAGLLAENLPWLFLDAKIDEAWLKRFTRAVEDAGAEIALPEWVARALGSDDPGQSMLLLISTMTVTHSTSVQHTAFAAGAGASGGVGGGSVGAR